MTYYNLHSFHLLQNASLFQKAATIVTKCVSYHKMRRHYKMPQSLLQNAWVITKSVVITTCHNPCYKMRELLQNPSLLQNATTLVTKCVSYYKIRRYYKCRNPCYKMRRHYKMPQNSVKLQSDCSLPYDPTNLLTFSNKKKTRFSKRWYKLSELLLTLIGH